MTPPLQVEKLVIYGWRYLKIQLIVVIKLYVISTWKTIKSDKQKVYHHVLTITTQQYSILSYLEFVVTELHFQTQKIKFDRHNFTSQASSFKPILNKLTSYISGSLDITFFRSTIASKTFFGRAHSRPRMMPNWLLTRVCASQEASSSSRVGLRSWRNALRLTTILSDRMKISSSKGETEISCFFEDSLTVMLSLGFQTTIIIVGQRFPANPGGKPNRWARSRRTVSTLNLSTLRNRTDTST